MKTTNFKIGMIVQVSINGNLIDAEIIRVNKLSVHVFYTRNDGWSQKRILNENILKIVK